MKRITLLLLSLAVSFIVYANDDDAYKFKLYGFVRNDFTIDSRYTIASYGDLFSYIPKDEKILADGSDANAHVQTNLLGITSRLGFDVKSPMYKDFYFNAKIEADFFGCDDVAPVFRLRHAFIKANYKQHHIMIGQSWHPMQENLIANIVSLNTGAPFSPFSRTPQVKYSVNLPHTTLTAAIIYQCQYKSVGPEGKSMKYQVNGGLPEFYVGAEFGGTRFKCGMGAEYTRLRPRHTTTIDEKEYSVNEWVRSASAQLYLKYSGYYVDFMAKSLYGENVAHLLMMSGYGACGVKADGVSYEYAPLRQSTSWASVSYHSNWPNHNIVATLFGGYMKNFGAAKGLLGEETTYCLGGKNIDSMFRLSPSIKYSYKDFLIGLEYEYTGVNYGEAKANYSIDAKRLISNHRGYLIVVYNFDFQFNKKIK